MFNKSYDKKVYVYYQKFLKRVHSISFGNEEYVGPFSLSGGLYFKLTDDLTLNTNVKVQHCGNKMIEIIRNPNQCNNLTWFSLITSQNSIGKAIADEIEKLVL